VGGYSPPKNPFKCYRCGVLYKSLSGSRKYCDACKRVKLREWQNRSISRNREHYRDKSRKISKRFRENLKMKVIGHYSNGSFACACCGERGFEFLTIDHVNGGGHRQLNELGVHGSIFYYWLVKHDYPSGYAVLCMNCNASKWRSGVCAHQRKGDAGPWTYVTPSGRRPAEG
jgi:hypothetical protein